MAGSRRGRESMISSSVEARQGLHDDDRHGLLDRLEGARQVRVREALSSSPSSSSRSRTRVTSARSGRMVLAMQLHSRSLEKTS